ncbi:hypothetical protein [Kitasatospora sp. NPDC093102]|uniref:hypothetical protein n=1 Tax=Kitasatospora sp. NPDC093102 TaxID=3155069 RepID=UPI00342AAD2C
MHLRALNTNNHSKHARDKEGASLIFERLDDGTEQMVVGKRASKDDHWSTGRECVIRDPVAITAVRTYISLLAELG